MIVNLLLIGHVLADPPAPPIFEPIQTVKGLDITVTYTDEDGDGKYDKTVWEQKNDQGQVIFRIIDKDDNNDGKAENSVVEEFKDPTKPSPTQKITRTRNQNDSGWREEKIEEDTEQDGKVNEVKTCTSIRGNSKFDCVVIKTDKSGNGVFEKEERLLAQPDSNIFDTKITRTYEDPIDGTVDGENQKDIKNQNEKIPESQNTPNMLKPAKGNADGPGNGNTTGASFSASFDGFLLNGLGSTINPLMDPALSAQFITSEYFFDGTDKLKNTGLDRFELLAGDEVLLTGVIPFLEYFVYPSSTQHLDPAARITFIGEFDLTTLQLAGVPSSSPFYDQELAGPSSSFILGLNDLLIDPVLGSYNPENKLIFRFDAYSNLSGQTSYFDQDISTFGTATIEAVIIPEPSTLLLLILSFFGMCCFCKYRKMTSKPL